jgi:hypothetical protein
MGSQGEIVSGISPRFQAQIEDLRLKCCIPKAKTKITLSGETVEKGIKRRF